MKGDTPDWLKKKTDWSHRAVWLVETNKKLNKTTEDTVTSYGLGVGLGYD